MHRQLLSKLSAITLAIALCLSSSAPAMAIRAPDDYEPQQVFSAEGYNGIHSDWGGDSLVEWWCDELGLMENGHTYISLDKHYVEKGSFSGIIAMDDYCWMPVDASDTSDDAFYIKLERIGDESQPLDNVTPATDPDLATALDMLSQADAAREFAAEKAESFGSRVGGFAIAGLAIAAVLIVLVVVLAVVVSKKGKQQQPQFQQPYPQQFQSGQMPQQPYQGDYNQMQNMGQRPNWK